MRDNKLFLLPAFPMLAQRFFVKLRVRGPVPDDLHDKDGECTCVSDQHAVEPSFDLFEVDRRKD